MLSVVFYLAVLGNPAHALDFETAAEQCATSFESVGTPSSDATPITPAMIAKTAATIDPYGNQSQAQLEIQAQMAFWLRWHKLPEGRSWQQTIDSLPKEYVYFFVRELLRPYRKKKGIPAFVRLVAQFPARDGVREALVEHLLNSGWLDPDRTVFTQNQIHEMLGGQRFREFFPWVDDPYLYGATRTKFKLAVYTAPFIPSYLRIDPRWVAYKADTRDVADGVKGILGYLPVAGYVQASRTLSSSREAAMRGLIVQGFYERSGNSLFSAYRDRGMTQIESETSELMNQLEENLTIGALSKMPALDRQLLVQFWQVEGNDQLVEDIRNRAIIVARWNLRFYPLRVEIHNFPSLRVLNKTKRFAKTVTMPWVKKQIQLLIADMESFLQVNQAHGALNTLIDSLPLSSDGKEKILKMAEGFDQETAQNKLVRLIAIRDVFKKRNVSWSPVVYDSDLSQNYYRYTRAYSAENRLSLMSMVIGTEWLDE